MGYSLWWRKETAMRLTLSLFLDELRVLLRTSLVAQTVKRLPAVQETRVRSLGWEDPLEKEMATNYIQDGRIFNFQWTLGLIS